MIHYRIAALVFILAACESGKNTPSDTGTGCSITSNKAGTDTTTWPAGLEDAVTEFEAVAGMWTGTLTCPDGSIRDVVLSLTPGSREDIYLASTAADGEPCEGNIGKGSMGIALDGFIEEEVTGTVDARYTTDGVTIEGTIGEVGLEIRIYDDAVRYGTFWEGSEITTEEHDCSAESWTRSSK